MILKGSRVLVTGASGGLGDAIVRACAARGSKLLLTGRNEEALRRLVAGTGGEFLVADLADPQDVDRLVGWAGDIDVLVSNAALPAGGEVETFSVEEIDRALQVNLRAPMVLSRVLGAQMASRAKGQIVFVSSLAAAFPTPGLTIYNATKSALASYGISLRGELAPKGVGVSIIYPGPIADAGMWADTGLEAPMGLRTRSPRDVGAAVVRAVEQNRPQLIVAPVSLRLGAFFARAAPGVFARLAPRMGSSKVTAAMAEALRHKR